MNVVFIGTAEFACPSIEALVAAREHRVEAVVTQPDRPSGREMKLTPSPVKEVALKHHLQIFQPEQIKTPAFIQTLSYLHPELIVVVAYGQILPKEILQLPKHGCVNVHGSLLPKYRGASPIQSALLHGDAATGVTTMFMDEGLDTGDIIQQAHESIRPDDNARLLHDRLAQLGSKLLLQTVDLIASGKAPRIAQENSQAIVCKKLTKVDGRMDWSLPARELWNRVRAFNPWPGSFCHLQTRRVRRFRSPGRK